MGRFWRPWVAVPVFVLCPEAVSQNKQYFGPGTRLTVLGKRGHPPGRTRVFVRDSGAVTERPSTSDPARGSWC